MVLHSPGLGKESIVINHKSIQVSLQVGGTAQDGPVGHSMEVCYANALEQAARQVMRQAARSLPTEYGMFGYNEDEAFQELLRRSGPHPHEKVLRVVAGTCSSQSLMRLIELGAEIDAPEGSKGPLHAAAFGAREDHVRILLAANADPNRGDERGRSPLHFAALLKLSSVIQLLVDAGARINALDEKKRTPLHYSGANDYACRRNFSGDRLTESIRVLVECGANPCMKDAQGKTAWQTAAFEKSRDELIAYQAARQLVSSAVPPLDGIATRSIRETTLPDSSSSRSCR